MEFSTERDIVEQERVIFTAVDSLSCKLSLKSLGYLDDPFVDIMFAKRPKNEIYPLSTKRLPIINRGYYSRVQSISLVIDRFISLVQENSSLSSSSSLCVVPQIVSIGAGLDTLSLRVSQRYNGMVDLYEVDFPSLTSRKIAIIESEPESLQAPLQTSKSSVVGTDGPASTSTGKSSRKIGNLAIIGADIRDASSLYDSLLSMGFQSDMPTLFICECVLVYLDQEYVSNIIRCLNQSTIDAAWLVYDMMQPNDRFGQTMLRNLNNAGFKIPGFLNYPTLLSQTERFLNNGCDNSQNCTMLSAYKFIISKEEQLRVSRLEMLDEIEEWEMLMNHYSFTIATRGRILAPLVGMIP